MKRSPHRPRLEQPGIAELSLIAPNPPAMIHKADIVIIGGGPAGLSAALVLARCTRSVIVLDEGLPRNRFSHAIGGFLSRDGIAPAEFRRTSWTQLRRYGVRRWTTRATSAARLASGAFAITDAKGARFRARKLLLATGVADILPDIPGLKPLYGKTVHHCPYCDAWPHRGKKLIALGAGSAALGLALCLRTWTTHVTACTLGRKLSARDAIRARKNGIKVRSEQVARLDAQKSRLHSVVFDEGRPEPCDALFFNTAQVQRSNLAESLGCRFNPDGGIKTDSRQCTGIPGLYLAGDADKDVQFVIVAAAEGAIAATAINRDLQNEDRDER